MHEMRGGGWRGHPSFRLCFTSPRGRGPRTEAFSRAGIPCQFTPSRFSGRGSAAVKTDHPERPRGTNAIPFHSNTRGFSLFTRDLACPREDERPLEIRSLWNHVPRVSLPVADASGQGIKTPIPPHSSCSQSRVVLTVPLSTTNFIHSDSRNLYHTARDRSYTVLGKNGFRHMHTHR